MIRGGKLSQQFFTDMMAKVERARMAYIVNNQKILKAERYKGLIDAKDRDDLPNAGKVIILPPSVTGSPRWYVEQLQDALAIVRQYGKPTVFLTLTCNPEWSEITNSLEDGERWSDRPDIVARVFRAKLRAMMDLLTKGKLLGDPVYWVYSIEWQKRRGLPHCHLLLKLKEEPRTPEDIDRLVSAEIPGNDDPALRKLVCDFMLHGPCGPLNPSCPCMDFVGTSTKKECKKKFPQCFCKETTVDENSFINYRRRSPEDGGETFVNDKGILVDNRWVVPWNKAILQAWKGHANLVIVTSVVSVKYVFKYQHKGPDRIMMSLEACGNSEVEQFVTGRYLSAAESCWRLLGFKLTKRSHGVQKLACHLKNEHCIVFQEGQEDQALQRGEVDTSLMAWFKANRGEGLTEEDAVVAKATIYPDFPGQFVFARHKWHRRKQGTGKTIGRVPCVPLNMHTMETYSLRLILHHKAGAISYEDLRTVDGEILPSFQAAAVKMGLLDDDRELDKAMVEAFELKPGSSIRALFFSILIYCRPCNPGQFYLDHKERLLEDWCRDMDVVEAETRFSIIHVDCKYKSHF